MKELDELEELIQALPEDDKNKAIYDINKLKSLFEDDKDKREKSIKDYRRNFKWYIEGRLERFETFEFAEAVKTASGWPGNIIEDDVPSDK